LSALESSKPDVVVHLASAVVIEHTDSIDSIIESNIRFPTLLLDAMIETGSKRLINTGTSWQHFNDKLTYDPVNLYAASKQAFADIAVYYERAHLLRLRTLKLFDVYGSRDDRRKLIPLLLNVRLTGEPLDLSPGEQIVDLVHVEDVARAYLAVAEHLMAQTEPDNAEYMVRSGELVSIRELVAMIERVGERPLPVKWGGRKYRAREVMKPSSLVSPVPGWRPHISLESGLRSVIADFDQAKRD
jgi:nucleoside-diphosphate-sugar epimerase